jgi:hypothetical protein
LARNSTGEQVPPAEWTHHPNGAWKYKHDDGRKQDDPPDGSKPEGIIAIAKVIPDMRAMTSLNLASNDLGVEGAKIIAACLPKCK